MKLRQEINIIILVNHFEKGAKKKNHLQHLQEKTTEFLMKGKSMSQKKLLKRFLCIQALYSELCGSYCEKRQRNIY